MLEKSFIALVAFAFLAAPSGAAIFDTGSNEQLIELSPIQGGVPLELPSAQNSVTVQTTVSVEEANYKSAVMKIEEAETIIRQDLATFNVRLREATTRLEAAKAERKGYQKQIRDLQSKLKNTARAKKLILQNFPQQM
jgi:hypothetical protein